LFNLILYINFYKNILEAKEKDELLGAKICIKSVGFLCDYTILMHLRFTSNYM